MVFTHTHTHTNALKSGPRVTFRVRTKVVIILQQRFTDAPWVLSCLWHSDRFREAWCLSYSKACVCVFSPIWLSVTPWTVARQAPLSMGIHHPRILEWVAMPSSRGFSQPRDRTQVSHIASRFFTSWATREAQEYWSALPCPPPGDFLNPGIGRRNLLCLLQCKQILYPLSHLGATHHLYLNKNENK